jgi:chromosome segregation protein
VQQQTEVEQGNLAKARVILQESIEKMEADTLQREELMTQRDIYRTQLDEVRQTARHDRDRRQEMAMREGSLTTQLNAIREVKKTTAIKTPNGNKRPLIHNTQLR